MYSEKDAEQTREALSRLPSPDVTGYLLERIILHHTAGLALEAAIDIACREAVRKYLLPSDLPKGQAACDTCRENHTSYDSVPTPFGIGNCSMPVGECVSTNPLVEDYPEEDQPCPGYIRQAEEKPCPRCKGSGQVTVSDREWLGEEADVCCPDCGGWGYTGEIEKKPYHKPTITTTIIKG